MGCRIVRVIILIGSVLLASENSAIAKALSADELFKDFVSRMLSDDKRKLSADLKVKVLRWRKAIYIRLLVAQDSVEIAQSVFDKVLIPSMRTFAVATNLKITKLGETNNREGNFFILLAENMPDYLNQQKLNLIGYGGTRLERIFREVYRKSSKEPDACFVRIAYDWISNTIYWGVIVLPTKATYRQFHPEKCLTELMPIAVGWANFSYQPNDSLRNTIDPENQGFTEADQNWLRVLYRLPDKEMSLAEVRKFINENIEVLKQEPLIIPIRK